MTDKKCYQKTKKNTVIRGKVHSDYNKEVIYQILDNSYVCSISYIVNGEPYLNPTLFWRKDDYVYWHGGAAASGMLSEQTKGINVCFNVFHLDGLLLGKSAFHHSANYRSVTIYGVSEWVESMEDKIQATSDFIESFFPGRINEVREHKKKELNAVNILRLKIDNVSSKHRYDNSIIDILVKQKNKAISEYQPGMENPNCWTGLIPIRTIAEYAIPDSAANQNIPAPEYLSKSKFKQKFVKRI